MGKKNCSVGLCDMQTMIHCGLFIFLLGGLATTMSFYRNNKQEVAAVSTLITNTCDLFSGRWVHDNKSHYPLYREDECPYLEDTFACQTYGRKDFKYLQWRWQPHGCDFPGFNGKAVVERLRGKRLLFVGDSLNRNQWNSMICMLHSSIPGVKTAGGSGRLYTFRATDYNISIDFYWPPMLVESNGDSTIALIIEVLESKPLKSMLDIGLIQIYSSLTPIIGGDQYRKNGGSLLDDPNQEYEAADSFHAYKKGLETWSDWVHTHIDPSKTKLFFMGATATHLGAGEWGDMSKRNCYGETEPVMNEGFWGSGADPKMLSILESSLSKLKAIGVNVQIINITQLTQCRKDAHTTVYRKYWRPLTDEQKKNPQLASDCSHWCVPGVPDIWNQLLLAYIFR